MYQWGAMSVNRHLLGLIRRFGQADEPWLEAVRGEIGELIDDCKRGDWDGYGAEPIKPRSICMAIDYLDALSRGGVARPEVGCCPSGCVEIDWVGENGDARMILSFDPDDNGVACIYYSFLSERERHRGRVAL